MFRTIFILSLLVGCMTWSAAEADLVLQFDPSQTSIVSNGADQFVDVDLLLTFSGSGANEISGFTIFVQDPDPGTALTIPGPVTSNLDWSVGLGVIDQTVGSNRYVITGANADNQSIPSDNVLATVRFQVEGSVVDGSYPLDLTISNVTGGSLGSITDITSQVSAVNGSFTVSRNSGAEWLSVSLSCVWSWLCTPPVAPKQVTSCGARVEANPKADCVVGCSVPAMSYGNGGGTMRFINRRLVVALGILVISLCVMLQRVPAACLVPIDRASELMVSQTRQAMSDPEGVTTTLTDLYDGLGTYSHSLTLPGSTSASQTSQLMSSGTSIELAAVAPRESTEFGMTSARSAFQLNFDLECVAGFQLSGEAELDMEAPFEIADSTASLIGPNLANSYSAYQDGLQLNWSGNLSPGQYSLTLESHASGSVIESSSTSFAGQFQLVIHGDFNVDYQLTTEDIDLLTSAVVSGEYDPFYDLDQNRLLEPEDRRIWVEELKRTYFGDSDLNGRFTSNDFVAVFIEGKYETQQPATWGRVIGTAISCSIRMTS